MKQLYVAAMTITMCGLANAATINVPADYASIQDAIDASVGGDEILVAPGTYTGTGDRVIYLPNKPITVRATGTPEETILDGEGARGVVQCSSGEGADTIIEGFTITGGSTSYGGGIYCNSSSPTLAYTTVCGNAPDQIDGDWTDNGGNVIADECPDCPDINGDGEVGVDEILAVIAAWDTDDADADVNNDGIVDTNDILLVLAAWGPCP
jgi:hypothetical protein